MLSAVFIVRSNCFRVVLLAEGPTNSILLRIVGSNLFYLSTTLLNSRRKIVMADVGKGTGLFLKSTTAVL